MSDIGTGRMFALAIDAAEAQQLVRRRDASALVAWPVPEAMVGRLIAVCSNEGCVVAVAILDGSVQRDGATFEWMLAEVIAIRPVPCRVFRNGRLFALDSTVALMVVERAMDAAGLTVPVEKIAVEISVGRSA